MISPTMRAFPAQLFRGDFRGLPVAKPRTATGRPRRAIVIVPPNCSISSMHARHFAWNPVSLTTLFFMPDNRIAGRPGHLTARFGHPLIWGDHCPSSRHVQVDSSEKITSECPTTRELGDFALRCAVCPDPFSRNLLFRRETVA